MLQIGVGHRARVPARERASSSFIDDGLFRPVWLHNDLVPVGLAGFLGAPIALKASAPGT